MDPELKERLERLENRILRLEQSQVAGPAIPRPAAAVGQVEAEPEANRSRDYPGSDDDQLEFQVGTAWFSRVGIVVLALGAGFGISQPYPSLPGFAPSLGGFLLVLVILLTAHRWGRALGPLAGFVRGGGLILLYFATIRLFFFSGQPVLATGSIPGVLVLSAAPVACMLLAAAYRSQFLTGIAVFAGFTTALIVPVGWFSVLAILAMFAVAAVWSVRREWPWMLAVSALVGFPAFLLVMLNRPVLGNAFQWVVEPAASPVVLMACTIVIALGSLMRRGDPGESPPTVIGGVLNGTLGLLAFFLCTEAGNMGGRGGPYLAAAIVYLAIATTFWMKEKSRLSTFVYSMTGYLALTIAIIKFSGIPNVFVWLSMQSLVVVATAVWFQSRFIISTNFLIYLATIIGYLALVRSDRGISFVFGAVAMGSARILAWQKSRLHIKTEFMRNGYLLCAFAAFPYALYHLMPGNYVSLSWVGVALFYYGMNLVVNSPKYRWMGHGTLLMTVLYLIIVGIIQLKPAYRILSFVVLGAVLVGVSIVFSLLRTKRRERAGTET